MTAPVHQTANSETGIVISVDAMGGDRGPAAIVAGMALSAKKNPDIRFIVHGDEPTLTRLIAKRKQLAGICTIRHAAETVTMEEKPSHVMRHGKDTSMWGAIESVRDGAATVAVSCGNTGALMAVSMIRLRKAPGVSRPAIAVLFPSMNPSGFNIMLDVGADVKADPTDLLQYALMGASYARNGQNLPRPRIGLLNVGTEEHKGRAEMKEAHDLIAAAAADNRYDYIGFVEGSDIPSSRVDVIVTDGFTGNVALKTAEGTARFFSTLLRASFKSTIFARLGALLSYRALQKLTKRTDPRRVNGGVFLGLNGTVVKSHGAADATGSGLGAALLRRKFSEDALRRCGLFFIHEDATLTLGALRPRFRGRLMIPIRDHQGRVVAFTARQSARTPDDDPAREAKYVNSPETPVFTKGNLLFNLDRARTSVGEDRPFVLVEGQLDALRCWSVGLKTAVAPQGTSITDSQLILLRRYHPQVECFFDSDEAGQKAALRFLPLALRAGQTYGFDIAYEPHVIRAAG